MLPKRILVDGQPDLELLGRKDHQAQSSCYSTSSFQVKLRGHRIELGEVEHLLRRCLGRLVTQLAVQLISERLVAFCVCPAELSPAAAAVLRAVARHLAEQQLPRAMRPQVVLCKALPLTSSGKVARDSLQQLHEVESDEEVFHGFRHQVADIWQQELGAQRIKCRSHFQELFPQPL